MPFKCTCNQCKSFNKRERINRWSPIIGVILALIVFATWSNLIYRAGVADGRAHYINNQ